MKVTNMKSKNILYKMYIKIQFEGIQNILYLFVSVSFFYLIFH